MLQKLAKGRKKTYHLHKNGTCLRGLVISGRGAVKAWLAIRQGVGSYPTPAGMSSQVSA